MRQLFENLYDCEKAGSFCSGQLTEFVIRFTEVTAATMYLLMLYMRAALGWRATVYLLLL